MDRFSFLIDRQHRFLLIGIVVLVIAMVFTLAGGSLERFRGIVYRTEEPKRFWWSVATWYLIGLFFIGLFLYKNFKLRRYRNERFLHP